MKLFLKTLIFSFLYSATTFAAESLYESHQHIKDRATSFLTSQLSEIKGDYNIHIKNIDHRLKLKKCTNDIQINLTQSQVKPGKNTLNVQCVSSTPWRIFMSADVKLFLPVLVTKRPLNKGHLIQKNDIKLEKVQLTGHQSAYLSNPKQALNHVLKRRMNRGDIISVNNLSKPVLIKKGDGINIRVNNNGFQISMKGIALAPGSKGEKIKVKNSKTKKIIQGTIFNSSTVIVDI
jgi:flagella basal body P-ring formation protein FlgA